MSTALQAFAFDSHAVRVVMKDDAPWFVAKDVTNALSLDRTQIRRLDDDEKGVCFLHTPGGEQEVAIVNESGLYALILRSHGATTPGHPIHTFRKWVTSEVLPSIRKTGQYTEPVVASAAPASSLEASIQQLVVVVTKLVDTLPLIVQSMSAQQRQPRRRGKTMHVADMEHILALRKAGARLQDIANQSGFSSNQVWCVLQGQCEVQPGGRVTTNWRSQQRRMADQAIRAEASGAKSIGLFDGEAQA
jgi:prophage antirepressor-like protein